MSNNLNVTLGVSIEDFKKGFEDAVKVTSDATKDATKSAELLVKNVTASLDKIGNSKSLKSIQREMFNLAATFESGGDAMKPMFNEILKQAGGVKDRINDLNLQIEASTPDGPYKALNNTLQGSASLFAAAQGAMALFGNESEDVQKVLLKVQAAMALSEGLKGIESLKDGFMQLRVVMMANPILAVASAVIALGTAAIATAASFDDLSAAEEAELQVSTAASKGAVEQQFKLDLLTRAISDNTSSYEDKKWALEELEKLNPKIWKGQSIEGLNEAKLTALKKEHIRAIMLEIRTQAIKEKAIEAEKKKVDKIAELARKVKGDWDFTDYLYAAAGNEQQIYINIFKGIGKINEESAIYNKLLDESIDKQRALGKTYKDIYTGAGFTTSAGGGSASKPATQKKDRGEYMQGSKSLPSVLDATNNAFDNMKLKAPEAIKAVQIAFNSIDPANIEKSRAEVKAFTDELSKIVASGVIDGFANAITAAISGEDVGKAMGDAFASILTQMGDFMIEYGKQTILLSETMAAIQLAIASGIPGGAIPSGLVMVAAGAALKGVAASFNKKVPKYADGGVAYGQTVGMFGEYPNANINPEVVAPLSDLEKMIGSGSGGQMQLTGTLKARGEDLLVVVEAAKKKRGRG